MCPAIYLKILQEIMNFMVSAVHLLTVMFRIFMEKQDLLRIQSKVGIRIRFENIRCMHFFT